MTPLVYLAEVCCQIDKAYSVSLEYGAHAGDVPQWQMCVRLPLKAISLTRKLERGDDRQANVSAAHSLGEDLKRHAPEIFGGSISQCNVPASVKEPGARKAKMIRIRTSR